MAVYHLKEITYPAEAQFRRRPYNKCGVRVLIYGPGRAADIRNPRRKVSSKRLRIRSCHTILACQLWGGSLSYTTLGASFINWAAISSMINVKKNNLPLYINWEWKSELFETLLKGV